MPESAKSSPLEEWDGEIWGSGAADSCALRMASLRALFSSRRRCLRRSLEVIGSCRSAWSITPSWQKPSVAFEVECGQLVDEARDEIICEICDWH